MKYKLNREIKTRIEELIDQSLLINAEAIIKEMTDDLLCEDFSERDINEFLRIKLFGK